LTVGAGAWAGIGRVRRAWSGHCGCLGLGVLREYGRQTTCDYSEGGSIWFTEFNGNKIGKITKYSTLFQYPIPTSNSYTSGITAGLDGSLWFTESTGNMIGKVPKAW